MLAGHPGPVPRGLRRHRHAQARRGASAPGSRGRDPVRASARGDERGSGGAWRGGWGSGSGSRAFPSTTTRRRPPGPSGSRCPTCAGASTRAWRPELATPEGAPDAGPAEFNARSGASIVGVRFPLIAFNVNLATGDLSVAKRIAEAVRFSGGGYRLRAGHGGGAGGQGPGAGLDGHPAVREDAHPPGAGDHHGRRRPATGWRWPAASWWGWRRMEAFEEVIRHYLQLHDFSVEQVIESRLLEV